MVDVILMLRVYNLYQRSRTGNLEDLILAPQFADAFFKPKL